MYSITELAEKLKDTESSSVERTRAAQDSAKIGEAICAFANDLPGRGEVGVLFVGANDDGTCSGLEITDELLRRLASFATDGRVNPLPMMQVRKEAIEGCTFAVVEVTPSDNPPVKFGGRVCVRRGPLKGYSTPEEDRRLTERRRANNLPADLQPVSGSSVSDLDLLRFQREYLPAVFAPDVLEENGRALEDQLRALRLVAPDGRPTIAGMLILGQDPRSWLPGAYVQFVRYPDTEIGEVVSDAKEIGGPLAEQLRYLDDVIKANIQQGSVLSGVIERSVSSYPVIALQELIRNAVIHRNYIGTATPVRLSWFEDRVEITSPGGPYGEVTAENFGQPFATSYRNPTLASAARDMQFVQRFGSGIARAQRALAENGNPLAKFTIEGNFVHVVIKRRP
jgi:ATP-dependent DNA helicase RecG